MNDYSIEETNLLHSVGLEIIKEFVKICDEEGLTYYLSGGSLLGAVRHKGYIPWDDDADFTMPREDYEKFLAIADERFSERLQITNYKTDPNYHYYITRIQDTNTTVIEERIEGENKYTHVSIDIFPLDGTPNGRVARNIHYFRVMFHRAMMSICYKDSIDKERKRNIFEQVLISILLLIPIEKVINPFKEKEKIDKLMRKYDINKSEKIGCLMGAYRTKQIVPKYYFGNGAYYDFENLKLRGPEMFDEYLKQMYGEYRKIPSVKNRKIHYKLIEVDGEKVAN
ncbi:LicD family protein [Enterococcus avium]|uniref:LicD family protein n=1 Tax=Enterococcus avium TaxID=33945 RepID=UPI00288D71AA|nr:LicD family protein [Enterococcus avium]MDT2565986.1 LicD family protein [Enterococcus avium]